MGLFIGECILAPSLLSLTTIRDQITERRVIELETFLHGHTLPRCARQRKLTNVDLHGIQPFSKPLGPSLFQRRHVNRLYVSVYIAGQ